MRIYLFVLLLLVPLLLSGCQFKDIDKRFFVVSIGIDKPKQDQEQFQVSFKVAIPSGTPKMGKEEFQIFSVYSDSLAEAMQRIKTQVDKELDFGHTKVLVIGESCAARDVEQAVDWMTRERFIQEIGWLVVGKPSAQAVLAVRPSFERLPSNALMLSFGDIGVESQFIVSTMLFEFFRGTYEEGSTPVLPVVEAKQDHFLIDHAIVFKNNRTALVMSDAETRMYNIFKKHIQKVDLPIRTKDNKYVAHMDKLSVKYQVEEGNGSRATIRAKVKMQGFIEERFHNKRITNDVLKEAARRLEQTFSTDAAAFLQKLQKQSLDPIELGLFYRSRHWQDHAAEIAAWNKLYPQAQFEVQTQVKLESTGTIQ